MSMEADISAKPQPAASARLVAIDRLRGLVMVLMALDHARHFWSPTPFRPVVLAHTTPELFLTRWVTHLCAPVFVFLAGTSAWLYGRKGRSRAQLARYLLYRGLWLIFLELTVVNAGWHLEHFDFILLQVIWVLGLSMVLLAGLVYLPRGLLAVLAIAVIAGHNLLDAVSTTSFGSLGWLWGLLHTPLWIPLPTAPTLRGVFVLYPLIPWVAVMAAGYVTGPVFERSAGSRKRLLALAGLGLIVAFAALRWLNSYGDPAPWTVQERGNLFTLLSFLNTTKYPPSLLFLCMTLGPALLLLVCFDVAGGSQNSPLIVFGRVPLFFYIVHLPLIHLFSSIWTYQAFGRSGWQSAPPQTWPAQYQPSLLRTYVVWIAITVVLYVICRYYGRFKQRHPGWWSRLL